MRNGQNNNNKRMRNNNNNRNNGGGGGGGNNNNNRRGQNPMTRVFESNGPDIKIRGTASHVAEKYVQLARDARSSGDPVAAENYYQHAEHYFRLIAAAQEQFRQNQPQPRTENEMAATDEGEDDGETFSNFGAEPGFVPVQQQPFVQRDQQPREHQPRDGQPYQQRENNHREHRQPQQPQPQPQFQPQQPQPQPAMPVSDSVDRLPSFITGSQPAAPGGLEANGANERFQPRRRRRPHGPRPEGVGAAAPAPAPSEDFNPGNS